MTTLKRVHLEALVPILSAQFDGDEAPCSIATLRALERAELVTNGGGYVELTRAGWAVLESLGRGEIPELTAFRRNGELRILAPFGAMIIASS